MTLAASGAAGQVTNVSGTSSTQVQLSSLYLFGPNGPGIVTQGGGAAFDSLWSVNSSKILFESGNASRAGANSVTTTSSSVFDFTINNGGVSAIAPILQTRISGGGLGFYLANTSGSSAGSGLFPGGDPYGGFGQTAGGQTFANMPNLGTLGQVVADAEFQYTVAVGGSMVYDLTAIEQLTVGASALVVSPLEVTVNASPAGAGPLQGLKNFPASLDGSANGFLWGNSNLDIGLGAPLAGGASEDVVITESVTTFSMEGCDSGAPSVCLASYAALGNPLGPVDGVSYVDNWGPQTMGLPTFNFDTGILSFAAATPEPATWALMLAGFAGLGATLRSRRRLTTFP